LLVVDFWFVISFMLMPSHYFFKWLNCSFSSSIFLAYSCFLVSSILRSFSISLSSFSIWGLFYIKFLPAILSSFLRLKMSFLSCEISAWTWIFYSMTSLSFLCFFADSRSLISRW
jgi:hypothetical protein